MQICFYLLFCAEHEVSPRCIFFVAGARSRSPSDIYTCRIKVRLIYLCAHLLSSITVVYTHALNAIRACL